MPATVLWAEGFAGPPQGKVFSSQTQWGLQWGRGTPQRYAMRGNSSGVINVTLADQGVASSATFGVAMAVSRAASAVTWLDFLEGSTVHVRVGTDANGNVLVYRGPGTTLLGTSSGARLVVGNGTSVPNFHHLEVRVTVHDSTGAVRVRLDEVDLLTLTSQDTQNGGTGVIDKLDVYCSAAGVVTDLVLTDGADWFGDKGVVYLVPNGDGTYTSGTASAGTRTQCVDDVGSYTEDADYVTQDATGLPKNVTFTLTNLPTNATAVHAVLPVVAVRKDDAGTNTGRVLVRSSTTDSDGGADITLTTGYVGQVRCLLTDPATSSAWTTSAVDALEAGWRRTA